MRLDEFSAPADIDGSVDTDERHRFNAIEFDITGASETGKKNKFYMRYNYGRVRSAC